MTESSRYWNTNDVGDGPTAGFDRDAIAEWLRSIWARGGSGVLFGVLNSLAVTGSASPLSVNTGTAIVYGLYYWNSASVNLTVTTPSIGTTGGRVVLRASWSAQTVRLVAVRNTDGVAAIPSLTQTPGTTYEISLATFTITTGGAITVTDDRSYVDFSDYVIGSGLSDVAGVSVIGRASNTTGQSAAISAASDGQALRRSGTSIAFGTIATDGILNNAISNALLRQSAGLSVVGRSANSTGDVADITAASDGYALMRSGTSLVYGQLAESQIPDLAISTAKIANDQVDNSKVGSQIPQFTGRQGNYSTDWNASGTNNYSPTAVRIVGGSGELTFTSSQSYAYDTINFSSLITFSNIPLYFASCYADTTNRIALQILYDYVGTYSFKISAYRSDTSTPTETIKFHWLAIGPE